MQPGLGLLAITCRAMHLPPDYPAGPHLQLSRVTHAAALRFGSHLTTCGSDGSVASGIPLSSVVTLKVVIPRRKFAVLPPEQVIFIKCKRIFGENSLKASSPVTELQLGNINVESGCSGQSLDSSCILKMSRKEPLKLAS